jgi:hypothetical protein
VESPGYLAWLDERPDRDHTLLMGANTYRLMSGFATSPDTPANEAEAMADLTRQQKVVFSSTLDAPLEPKFVEADDETPLGPLTCLTRDTLVPWQR